MIEVERAWGKHPGWFAGLAPTQQAEVMGAYWARVRKPPESDKKPPPRKRGRR